MTLMQIIPFAHQLLQTAVSPGDVVVDCTMGNGHDSLFLARLVGDSGLVYAFDIQAEALVKTKELLKAASLAGRVSLHCASHHTLEQLLPHNYHGKVTGAIFNLGYLPGGDKSVVTTPDTTTEAIEALLRVMAPGGIIVLVVYHGHPGGQIEREALLEYTSKLPREIVDVLCYRFLNYQNTPPFIIALQKK